MAKILTKGAQIALTPSGPWIWASGGDLIISVDDAESPLSSGSAAAPLALDLLSAIRSKAAGQEYLHIPAAQKPGKISSIDPALDSASVAALVSVSDGALATDETTGSFTIFPATPSELITPAGSTPDAQPSHRGTWRVVDPGQSRFTEREGSAAVQTSPAREGAAQPAGKRVAQQTDDLPQKEESGPEATLRLHLRLAPPDETKLQTCRKAFDLWGSPLLAKTRGRFRLEIAIAQPGRAGGVAGRFTRMISADDFLERGPDLQVRPVEKDGIPQVVKIALAPVRLDPHTPIRVSVQAAIVGRGALGERRAGMLSGFSPPDQTFALISPSLPSGPSEMKLSSAARALRQPEPKIFGDHDAGRAERLIEALPGRFEGWRRFETDPPPVEEGARDWTIIRPALERDFLIREVSTAKGKGLECEALELTLTPDNPGLLALHAAQDDLDLRCARLSDRFHARHERAALAHTLSNLLRSSETVAEAVRKGMPLRFMAPGAFYKAKRGPPDPGTEDFALRSKGLLRSYDPENELFHLSASDLYLALHYVEALESGYDLARRCEFFAKLLIDPGTVEEQGRARARLGPAALEWKTLAADDQASVEELFLMLFAEWRRIVEPSFVALARAAGSAAQIASLLQLIEEHAAKVSQDLDRRETISATSQERDEKRKAYAKDKDALLAQMRSRIASLPTAVLVGASASGLTRIPLHLQYAIFAYDWAKDEYFPPAPIFNAQRPVLLPSSLKAAVEHALKTDEACLELALHASRLPLLSSYAQVLKNLRSGMEASDKFSQWIAHSIDLLKQRHAQTPAFDPDFLDLAARDANLLVNRTNIHILSYGSNDLRLFLHKTSQKIARQSFLLFDVVTVTETTATATVKTAAKRRRLSPLGLVRVRIDLTPHAPSRSAIIEATASRSPLVHNLQLHYFDLVEKRQSPTPRRHIVIDSRLQGALNRLELVAEGFGAGFAALDLLYRLSDDKTRDALEDWGSITISSFALLEFTLKYSSPAALARRMKFMTLAGKIDKAIPWTLKGAPLIGQFLDVFLSAYKLQQDLGKTSDGRLAANSLDLAAAMLCFLLIASALPAAAVLGVVGIKASVAAVIIGSLVYVGASAAGSFLEDKMTPTEKKALLAALQAQVSRSSFGMAGMTRSLGPAYAGGAALDKLGASPPRRSGDPAWLARLLDQPDSQAKTDMIQLLQLNGAYDVEFVFSELKLSAFLSSAPSWLLHLPEKARPCLFLRLPLSLMALNEDNPIVLHFHDEKTLDGKVRRGLELTASFEGEDLKLSIKTLGGSSSVGQPIMRPIFDPPASDDKDPLPVGAVVVLGESGKGAAQTTLPSIIAHRSDLRLLILAQELKLKDDKRLARIDFPSAYPSQRVFRLEEQRNWLNRPSYEIYQASRGDFMILKQC